MRVGVQFTGSLAANQSGRWFTFNWPEGWDVIWSMMPITAALGAPELQWDVAVERGDPQHVTYWLTVTNLTGQPINFEGRYAVLN